LLGELGFDAEERSAIPALCNVPAGKAIDDYIFVRDQERLFKDRIAKFFKRQEALKCGPVAVVDKASMWFKAGRAAHHCPADGLVAASGPRDR
jgi:hypothetical protein